MHFADCRIYKVVLQISLFICINDYCHIVRFHLFVVDGLLVGTKIDSIQKTGRYIIVWILFLSVVIRRKILHYYCVRLSFVICIIIKTITNISIVATSFPESWMNKKPEWILELDACKFKIRTFICARKTVLKRIRIVMFLHVVCVHT